MHIASYLAALFIGMATSRSATLMARGGVQPTNLAASLVGFLAMIATCGLIVLGFFLYSWWVPIVCFLGISIALAFLITRSTLRFFHVAEPVMGIATVLLCGYGWYAWASA
jgi:hypothetical protein